MLILRKAELTDFETYKKLLQLDKENLTYQWLYNDTTVRVISEEEQKSSLEFFKGFETAQETIDSIRIRDFFPKEKKSYVYFIEQDKKLQGYVEILDYSSGSYRIAWWGMLNPNDERLKQEVLAEITKLKLPRLREFTICTPSESTAKWLLANKFEEYGVAFYRLKVKQRA